MTIFKKKSRLVLAAALLVGLASFGFGYHLLTWQDAQVVYYNQGIAAYKSGDPQTALELFDKSLGVYRQRQRAGWKDRFIYPAPNQEFAALANFQKAKSLLRLRKAEPAVEAFKESLRLNPGNDYDSLSGLSGASKKELDRLVEQALTVKYDLELLFNNNQQLADGQGKEGQKGEKGEKGDKKQQSPGKEPGELPGKGNKDEI